MNGLTRVEQEFYESVLHDLGRIADSLEKLVKSKERQTGKTEVSVDVPMKDAHPLDSDFDVLAVTDVEVFPFTQGPSVEHIKGLASIVLNDQLNIRGLRIMDGENGLFVGYPPNPFYKGEDFRSICFPITRQLKEHIENCVLEKYRDATK